MICRHTWIECVDDLGESIVTLRPRMRAGSCGVAAGSQARRPDGIVTKW
jgi:hypothetical protein